LNEEKRPLAESGRILKSGEIFGESYDLTGNKWRPCFVIATAPDTLVFEIDYSFLQEVNKVSFKNICLRK